MLLQVILRNITPLKSMGEGKYSIKLKYFCTAKETKEQGV